MNLATFRKAVVEKIILRNKSLIDVKMEGGSAALHVAAINDHNEAALALVSQVNNDTLGLFNQSTRAPRLVNHRHFDVRYIYI